MDLKSLYIKKCKLKLINEFGEEIPDNSTVGTYMLFQPRAAYKPKYRINGIFIDGPEPKFLLTDMLSSTHHLYLSVLVNPSVTLDNYKLIGTVWSSYFEDRHGYYWQVVNTEKLSHYNILHPKLITQA